jgi:hypothetical protein
VSRLSPFLLLAAIAVAVTLAVNLIHREHHKRCTHGVSSIGPVRVVDGKPRGSTRPHTEACLR